MSEFSTRYHCAPDPCGPSECRLCGGQQAGRLPGRHEAARLAGITYATLRVYERHLGGLLDLRPGPRKQGARETVTYTVGALAVLHAAVAVKRRGLPFTLLRDYFSGRLVPPVLLPRKTTP